MIHRPMATDLVAEGLWYAISDAPNIKTKARATWLSLTDAERELWRTEAERVVRSWLEEATAQDQAA